MKQEFHRRMGVPVAKVEVRQAIKGRGQGAPLSHHLHSVTVSRKFMAA